jgi:hypothetical protein
MHILAVLFTLTALGLAFAVIGITLVTHSPRIIEALIGPVSPINIAAASRANVTPLRASCLSEAATQPVSPLPLAA